MANALIYSPRFDGHRLIHISVYCNILEELGFSIFIAGSMKEKISHSFYIDMLKKNKKHSWIDTSIYSKNGIDISNNELISIQNKNDIDLTIFAEADHHLPLFNNQILNKKKRINGKTVGLFLRPFYYYERLSFLNKLRYIKHLNANWKADPYLFHSFFLKRFKLLDYALYLDENFVTHHKGTYYVPDVFQRYAETLIENDHSAQRVWISQLNRVKEKNFDQPFFLYFGTSQARRGYDTLLKMAVDLDGCFIHYGLKNETEKYKYNVSELKKNLIERGRLLETDEYIFDPLCIEHFFKSVTHLVLPYTGFYGSSGVMLMALSNGVPVLVPQDGIMGYLVKKYSLGLTYENEYTLSERFKEFQKIPALTFADSISNYMRSQTPEKLKKILINIFNACISKN